MNGLSCFARRMTTLSRRPDWKALAPFPHPGPTFAAQPTLSKLPVPDLQQTLARLKRSLKPIAWSDAEYAAVVSKIDRFASGLGPRLQERLVERQTQTDHWLEEWWDRDAYLAYRDSVVVNVSYYYGFDEHPSFLPQSAVARAAALIRAALLFRQRLNLGQIRPEATKEGPLCMDTWRWMFDCSRVPDLGGCDWSRSYAHQGDAGHVIVIRRGRFWKIKFGDSGELPGTAELEDQIQHIIDNTVREYPAVGVLTASNRDIWAKDYAHLRSDEHNSKIIDEIESSAFITCLDVEQPSDPVDFSRFLWHGAVSHSRDGSVVLGLRNRWVDKPCQFVVFDNGKAGFMGEHSIMDGTPTVTLCDQVLEMLKDPKFDHGPALPTSKVIPTPLDFNISSQTGKAIAEAKDAAFNLVDSQALSFHLTSYGKAAIKKFGISPDSWAQMIIQVAYGRLLKSLGQKRNGGTYESATTRRFYKGRTEVIRVVSSESDAFVQSMLAPPFSMSVSEKQQLFRKAAEAHITTAKNAGSGQGFDRHLMGLKKLLKEDEVGTVELFDDVVYKRSSHWVLSTSAIFSEGFRVYGWGEVVPDGFGVAYMTGFDDRLQYTITSRKEMPNKQFCDEIKKAADDFYELFEVKGKL